MHIPKIITTFVAQEYVPTQNADSDSIPAVTAFSDIEARTNVFKKNLP